MLVGWVSDCDVWYWFEWRRSFHLILVSYLRLTSCAHSLALGPIRPADRIRQMKMKSWVLHILTRSANASGARVETAVFISWNIVASEQACANASKSKRINGKFAFIFIVNFHYVVRLFEKVKTEKATIRDAQNMPCTLPLALYTLPSIEYTRSACIHASHLAGSLVG